MKYNSKPLSVTGNAQAVAKFKKALKSDAMKRPITFKKLVVTHVTTNGFIQTVTALKVGDQSFRFARIHYVHDCRGGIRFDRVESVPVLS